MLAEILDALSEGILTLIDPQNCKDMVRYYEKQHALEDFEKKLKEYHKVYKEKI